MQSLVALGVFIHPDVCWAQQPEPAMEPDFTEGSQESPRDDQPQVTKQLPETHEKLNAPKLITDLEKAVEPKLELGEHDISGVLVVQGNAGNGTAFLANYHDRLVVFTNQHVLAGQESVQILTQQGQTLQFTEIHAANNADLLMMMVAEAPERSTPLPVALDDAHVAIDLVSVIPGNAQGDGVVTITGGHVQAIGPQRLEVSNPVYPGNSGSPVIENKSGLVIGVLTEATTLSGGAIETASFQSPNSSIKHEVRYFAHRITTVEQWKPLDWRAFQRMHADLEKTEEELMDLVTYFTERSAPITVPAISRADQELGEILNSTRSPRDKMAGLTRFLRDLQAVIRTAQQRVAGRPTVYVHEERRKNLMELADNLSQGIGRLENDQRFLDSLTRRRRR